ncbi:hypothetical protein [Flavobacterium aquicola]|uniref:Uncharacterized protein n=1 Tax=Flavobacterium aquicola TaxID=1682742 RepID=A0A3E0EX27_9FLAO|nr:hypothetical protein [Flavobacterium aquicola]REH01717.1 hypothetical protein C8P67_101198 [Flavobacterium aquicola]
MKFFLKITAFFELATGLGLLFIPKIVILILLGTTLDGAGANITGMVAGTALIAIAYACWLAQDSGAVLIRPLLLYNTVVAGVLFFGFLNFKLISYGLWLTIVLHTVFSVWSLLLLLRIKELKKN